MLYRPRRVRMTDKVRALTRETRMSKDSLIYPIFIEEGNNLKTEISAMPGQYRYSPDRLPEILEKLDEVGIDKVILFGIPQEKDPKGKGAYCSHGIVQEAVKKIKRENPNMYVIGDVCLCEYTSHGHCGIIKGDSVDNDKTLELLGRTALSQVEAGIDMVAPSDMMDGRVGFIREMLDNNGFEDIPIMSYAVKYASAFYGPFREAAGSDFKGSRSSYQMDYHNRREAIKEAELDISEGADIIMVKPALAYLDIIRELKDFTDLPIAAYSVSGEYAMIKAAANAGYIDEEKMIEETTTAIYRAGSDILITYYAMELAKIMDMGKIG